MTDHNTIYIIDSDDEVQTLLPTPRQDSSVIDLEAEHIDLTQDDELPEKETKQDTMPVKKAIPTTSNTPKNPIPSNSAKKSSGKIVSAAISEVSALISSKKGSALVVPQKWNSASNLEERSSNAQLRKLITPGPQQKLSLSRSALLRTNSASKKSIRPAAVPLKRTMDAAGESLLKSPERRPPPPPMTRRTPPPPPPPMTRTPPPPPPPTQRRYKTSSSPFSKPTVPAVIRNHNIHEDDIDLDSFMNRITAGRKVATASTGPALINMMCPICKSLFPKNDLADHASDCTGAQKDSEIIVAEAVKVIHAKRGITTKSIASAVELDESERKRLNKGKIDAGPTNYYADSESVLALDGSGFNAEVTGMTWESAGSTTFGG